MIERKLLIGAGSAGSWFCWDGLRELVDIPEDVDYVYVQAYKRPGIDRIHITGEKTTYDWYTKYHVKVDGETVEIMSKTYYWLINHPEYRYFKFLY